MQLNTIRSEGSLILSDLIGEIFTGEAIGQKPKDFSLDSKVRLIDEIAICWSDAKAYWEAFQAGFKRVKEGESGATVTREQWVLPLLRTLGFDAINFSRSAILVGGRSYSISHRLGEEEHPLPVHIEGANFELDTRTPTGVPRISPHALVQEYLNRTDALWGIVTNGKQFRILRDSVRLTRPSYLEFNLEEMMEGEHFTDFQLFYRIAHRTRFPRETEKAHECPLEEYYQSGIETGGRVRERLRGGVEKALKIFGNGFLEHPNNIHLLELIREGKLSPTDYYRQLLRLIYRFLFLMVSEERKLVGPDPKNDKLYKLYTQNYSINRLREKVEHPIDPKERYWDLWEGVKQTFRLYSYKSAGDIMSVDVLNGDLFGSTAIPELEKASLYNRDFLHGFAHLSLFKEDKSIRRINYGYLDVEELGSVYESLLDYHPVFSNKEDTPKFELVFGTERKSTGSYYTRPELVQELIKSALVPVIDDRLDSAQTKVDKEKALLSLKVCDPASGSGHFLLAAARRIGNELAKVRSGEEQPTPTEFRKAVRDVIQHCIYGVDINPLAVDLCKVALWLEGHNRGYPLTFLDHRMKCGNSLVGVDTLDRLQEGIPSEAFNPVTGDDKEVSKKIKARNKLELKAWESGQLPLIKNIDEEFKTDLRSFAHEVQRVDTIEEREADDVGKKQQEYERLRTGSKWLRDWTAANIWTSAFFYPLTDENDPAIPTQDKLVSYLAKPGAAHGQLVGKANALSIELRFFHWSLEFPDVFETGGFDVVLGNPPWERIKLQEREFFATRDVEIAKAPNKAKRAKFIKSLAQTNLTLLKEFENAKHETESNTRFVRNGGRFKLTAVGDVNTYTLFTELSWNMINDVGRVGLIIPTGIATDDTTKNLFNAINTNKALVSLFDFENRHHLFPSLHTKTKFCLITISNKKVHTSKLTFMARQISDLDDNTRVYHLDIDDLKIFNPNTNTCPLFRTKVDLDLTKKIYKMAPIIELESTGYNPWGMKFHSMFHMANDSQLFISQAKYEYLPLYEAKLFYHFDHRWSTYTGTNTRYVSNFEKQNPDFSVESRYWVPNAEIKERLNNWWQRQWLFCIRNITDSRNERSVITSIIPLSGLGHTASYITIDENYISKICCLIGNFNSLVLDFVARQKIGGTSLTYFIIKQLPILSPEQYSDYDTSFISSRVLRLVFTAHDLRSFAKDMGLVIHPYAWDDSQRLKTRAELEAYYAKSYGLTREELNYILDPIDVFGVGFPSETFRILKENEIVKFGEYRTKLLVLEAWDRLFGDEA